MLKPTKPIKPTLEEVGYPFKSKRHSKIVDIYQRLGKTKSILRYLGEWEGEEPEWGSELRCPKKLKYQFEPDFPLRISDKCCQQMKEEPLTRWAAENSKKYFISGIMKAEGGRRMRAECLALRKGKLYAFQPLAPLTKEWEEWYIQKFGVDISDIYKPPYNFKRTGCKGCPFGLQIQSELDTLEKYFPNERKQCEFIWKPVYEEYRRIGYRLKANKQMTLDDYISPEEGENK